MIKKDYIGIKIGKFFVEGFAGIINKYPRWNCTCECGNKSLKTRNQFNAIIKNGKKTQCPECARKQRSMKGENNPRYRAVVSEETRRKIGLANKGKGRKPTVETIILKCKNCDGDILLTESHIKHGEGKYCSKKCRKEYENLYHPYRKNEIKVIQDYRHTPEYKAWRKSIYMRDYYTCQLCGDKTSGNKEAHHLLPKSLYPLLIYDIQNGITLCKECHKLVHNKSKTKKLSKILNNLIQGKTYAKAI